MKKQIIIIPIALALLCSCEGNTASKNTNGKSEVKSTDNKVSRKTLMITGDFNQITSLGGIDIVYTQGDFNIEIEGDSTFFPSVKADVDSGILSLYFSFDNNEDLYLYGTSRKLTAYITSPDLKCVALCSTGNFKSVNKWKMEDISLGVIGEGNFDIDSLECNSFKYEATGDGDAIFKHIDSSEKIEFTCMGSSDVTADINTNYLNIATSKGNINVTGKAFKKEISAASSSLISDNTTK